MRVALYLDNRGLAGRGALPRPSRGNPGLGGTEYEFLALAEQLVAQGSSGVEPLLLLTAPQGIEAIPPEKVAVVEGLAAAIERAEALGADLLLFRPGFATPADWSALEATRLPLLAWLHNLGCAEAWRYDALPNLRRWVLVSTPQADFFRHSRLVRRAVVIPNFVFTPPAPERTLAQVSASADLGYVGALTPFKGFHLLARHWGVIARRHPSSRLRVFGGANLYQGGAERPLTPYEQHCRRLLARGGFADRVVFEGSLGLERYGRLAMLRAVVVNPSGCDETFCLSAAECGAWGLPVVAGRRHALIDTVQDGRTGLLVRGGRELVVASSALLADPALAFDLGQRARISVAERFDPQATLRQWLALFEEVRSGAPAQPLAPGTPWHHEGRWLRQFWQHLQAMVPLWPDWPQLKEGLKRSPTLVGVLATLVALLVQLVVVGGKYHGNPTGLFRIGDRLGLSPLLQGQELVILKGKQGNDGQQYLTLALDPLQRLPGTSSALDNPIYRGKRLLFPLLGWGLGLGSPALIPWTLLLINALAVGLAAAMVGSWALLEGRPALWGASLLALPAVWIVLSVGTADLLSTSLVLSAAVAARLERPRTLVASLVAALLARETALLAWGGTVLTTLTERRWPRSMALLLVPLPLVAWGAWLRGHFSATADGLLASLHFTAPGLGLAAKAIELIKSPLAAEALFDRLCFLLLLATLAVLAATALRPGQRWLRFTSGVYLLPALCTSLQILARFPDYTRVWIDLSALALLALLANPKPVPRLLWLGGSALLSLGYGVGYLITP